MGEYFSVVSLSNCSLNRYPDNSNSKFKHILPKKISINPNTTYLIKLKSVSIAFNLKRSANKIGFFKIHLEELTPRFSLDETNERNCISKIPAPKNQKFAKGAKGKRYISNANTPLGQKVLDKSAYHYSFRTPPAFTFAPEKPEITELSYIITDEENNQLQLKPGFPTVICIEIVEMTSTHQQFMFSISPTRDYKLFPDNTFSSFKVSLPSETILPLGEWEVAVHSIIVPKHIRITPNNEDDSVDFIALYADFVEESIIGNAKTSFLEILSVKDIKLNETSSSHIYYIENLTFHTLSKEKLRNMQFDLRGLDGKPIQIECVTQKCETLRRIFEAVPRFTGFNEETLKNYESQRDKVMAIEINLMFRRKFII